MHHIPVQYDDPVAPPVHNKQLWLPWPHQDLPPEAFPLMPFPHQILHLHPQG